MSIESEKDVTKKRNKRDTIRDGVMRGKDEGTARLLMEQDSAKKWSLVRSKGRVYFFCNLLLPSGRGRCHHAEWDGLADDPAKIRDTAEGGVNASREQWMTLLYFFERVTPLLIGYVSGDLSCKCMVGGKVLIEEAKELFKGSEWTKQIA